MTERMSEFCEISKSYLEYKKSLIVPILNFLIDITSKVSVFINLFI